MPISVPGHANHQLDHDRWNGDRDAPECFLQRDFGLLGQRVITRACPTSQSTVHDYFNWADAVAMVRPLGEKWDKQRVESGDFLSVE
jgi:hypothetical protein